MSAFYAREISAGGAVAKDATPYASINEALAVILRHMRRGGVVKGWVEDQNGNIVMLPENVAIAFESSENSN